MARNWKRVVFGDLRHWKTLVAAYVFIASAASASSAPSTPFASSFLGAAIDKNGTLSLAFSGETQEASHGDTVMTSTLFSGQQTLKHSEFHGVGTGDAVHVEFQKEGRLVTADGSLVQWDADTPGQVTISANFSYSVEQNGVSFAFAGTPRFYGVWEYPWNKSITNNHYGANLSASTAEERSKSHPTSDIGIYGTQPGINWSNARAPFFFTDNGFGVYVDTQTPLTLGFQEGQGGTNVMLRTNEANLTYRIIYNQRSIKTLLGQFSKLSSYPLMATESAYGPIFWSDDFEQDFHDSTVRNSQDNINDAANRLDEFKIRATSFFADRE